ncbi:hypothetical protein EV294_112129 [Paenibacillus sp. BK033]|uniref:hypothetical protein n=1 Tax=Paenibacillus sp. BK033 TaxID=2512133 RepID=UPI001044A614|nr:hypothetical protein [Paenibacillus sp. BK033]TCM89664.1 hypothetical protein EV294_112129 [Paenibacillus sp. BK033]
MVRKYEDDEREAASIIAWTERRLEHAWSSGAVTMYHRQFKTMWLASFGTLDNVPQSFKDRFMALYNELKAKEEEEIRKV